MTMFRIVGYWARSWSTTAPMAATTPLAASTEQGFVFHSRVSLLHTRVAIDRNNGSVHTGIRGSGDRVQVGDDRLLIRVGRVVEGRAEGSRHPLCVHEKQRVHVVRNVHVQVTWRGGNALAGVWQWVRVGDAARAAGRGLTSEDVRLQQVRLRAEGAVVTGHLHYVGPRRQRRRLDVLTLPVWVVRDRLELITRGRCDGEVLRARSRFCRGARGDRRQSVRDSCQVLAGGALQLGLLRVRAEQLEVVGGRQVRERQAELLTRTHGHSPVVDVRRAR